MTFSPHIPFCHPAIPFIDTQETFFIFSNFLFLNFIIFSENQIF
ncbi:hypothetical protein LptCag_0302 [Leptospirillum ferriphilum]|uniref:Uncharacterized protein n=1 Tax=Leptospirillum ferriphilum TaxID=178606 RepID=A0A094YJ80_9BACT|nr:hypothetical protein LptCag_0302 [Leptospirillum ferriphilum]